MGLFVFGFNHKACPVEIREKLYFSATQLPQALEEGMKTADISELVILSTCNRVEFYGWSEELGVPTNSLMTLVEKTHSILRKDFEDYIYQYDQKEAMRHLFRVVAGLDSLVIGENEILGQVRDAFRSANAVGSVHSLLYRLMEKALKVGKDVRTKTKINEGAVSIPTVAVELAEKIFGHLQGEKVMVLGTGEMSLLTLKNLKSAGAEIVYVVSRNEATGQEVAAQFEADWISIEDWEKQMAEVDIVIASTSAPHAIVHTEQIKRVMERRRFKSLLLIDIAVPRNIESAVNSIDDVYLYNVDDLKGVSASNLKLRRREIEATEHLIDQAVLDYQGWLERLKARPTMESFERFLGDVISHEFNRMSKDLDLDPSKQEEIKQRIRAKILHPPLEKIKEASRNGGVTRYLEALHSLFDLKE